MKAKKFSKAQLDDLRKAYGKIDGVAPEAGAYDKLCKKLDDMPFHLLKQLAESDIKFLSGLARNRVMRREAGK